MKKRLLSAFLVLAMVLTLPVSYTHLGIIEGKPDGSYAPGEGVDRAQMAKMISVIMNQGCLLYTSSPRSPRL